MAWGRKGWLALGVAWLLGLGAIVLGKGQVTPMDEHGERDRSCFELSSPGVTTIHDTGPPESIETYGYYLNSSRVLYTVEYVVVGRDRVRAETLHPVGWAITVPSGARLFSVTGGVSPARTREFWVGWIRDREVHLKSLSGPVSSSSILTEEESPIFPAVMDGSGAASFYTWRRTANGAALWQRVFSPSGGPVPARLVVEVPGRPVVSRIAAVPGRRSQHAVVGWVERTESVASVAGIAVVENEHATVRRSPPIQWTAPIGDQRLGVWAGAIDRVQVAAVVVGDGVPPTFTLMQFGAGPDAPEGALRAESLELSPGQLARAAIDYQPTEEEPRPNVVLLSKDGLLSWDGEPRLRTSSVSLDSVLPIAITAMGPFWGKSSTPNGRLVLDPL